MVYSYMCACFLIYSPFLEALFMRDLWMCGMTPPPAMVALIRVSNSSSPRIASCKCRGVIRFTCVHLLREFFERKLNRQFTFKSLDALPASSSTSAVKYSMFLLRQRVTQQILNSPRMAAEYTAAVAPTRPPEAARFYEKYCQYLSLVINQVDEGR